MHVKTFARGAHRFNPRSQRGMALLVSLVFLLLLTLIGISSMQNANLQEKMSGSVKVRNESFQFAESALRVGESIVQASTYDLAVCSSTTRCAPPAEATNNAVALTAGANATSGVTWVAVTNGFYGIQKLGTTKDPVNVNQAGMEDSLSWTTYRITGVGNQGASRTVLESIYVKK
ncbi:pilus assembly protein PilX [Pseudomonas gingeri NCPPB 3146 = LMG 5327]|uniref:Pilus assembly protein PilX n=3 Tax=Pseudomonas TaxID=286 RepID=A0A7Y7Y303_9PSED|nr:MULTISPECIES: PilX N-terminal domain-containing pilus assembly protein [Pseudomonas]NVZ25719.1 pilus assembly protein PilX [Pseudomonas gingeri]NWA04443.1 pilus assembly protein PilX [Pseudomonas gingeri]NWA06281.1 pilus assembly protein PilX [Pseudomonas gingeri]NWA15580.1 pilus assembly protein PilX [Pseudomonas gingeri]NWA58248.1 pilus assembly protein PilX [Pseudomonas gingeri]